MEVTKFQIDKYKGINFVLYEDYLKLEVKIKKLEELIKDIETKFGIQYAP